MYCRKCGKEVKDDASFCPYCGQSFSAQQDVVDKVAQKRGKKESKELVLKIRFDRKMVIILALVAVLLLLLLCSVIKQVYVHPEDKLCHIPYCRYVEESYTKMSLLKALLSGYDIHKCLSIL